MTTRTCAFTAADNAAWPALSNGDTWTIEDVLASFGVNASGYPKAIVRSNAGVIAASLNKPMVVTNGPAADVTTDATTMGTSASWTPPANGIAIAVVMNSKATSADIPTLTGNGLTWTRVRTDLLTSTNFYRVSIFVAATGATPSAGTIIADCGANTQTGWFIASVGITGVPTTNGGLDAIRQSTYASGTSTALAGSLAALGSTGSYAFSVAFQARSATLTTPTGITAVSSQQHATPAAGTLFGYSPATGGAPASTSFAETITSAGWSVTMFEVVDDIGNLIGGTAERHLVAGTTTDLESEVYVDLPAGAVATGGPYPGIILRRTSSTSYWYAQIFTTGKTSHVTLAVGYVNAGTVTQLATIDTSSTAFTSFTRLAARVTVLATGETWIRAKTWISASESEPAWPTNTTDANTTRMVNITDAATPAPTAMRTTAGSSGLSGAWTGSTASGSETALTFDNFQARNFAQPIIALTGLDMTMDFGATVAKSLQYIGLTGIDATFALGAPSALPGGRTLTLTGIDATLALGAPSALPGRVTLALTGIDATLALGALTLQPGQRTISLAGIDMALALGAPSALPGARLIGLSGIDMAVALGALSALAGARTITLSGIDVVIAPGVPTVSSGALILALGGIDVAVDLGHITAAPGARSIALTGIDVSLELGNARALPGAIALALAGIDVTIEVGPVTPVLLARLQRIALAGLDIVLEPGGLLVIRHAPHRKVSGGVSTKATDPSVKSNNRTMASDATTFVRSEGRADDAPHVASSTSTAVILEKGD